MPQHLYQHLLDIEEQLNRAKATPLTKGLPPDRRERCYSLIAAAKICVLAAMDLLEEPDA